MSAKALFKSASSSIGLALGVNHLLRRRLKHHLLVLCYHGVVRAEQKDRFGYGNTVTEAEFLAHLEFLARHYQPVSAGDVIAHHNGGKLLPQRAALVTFDDGYRNNLTLAAPILRQVGVPCVFHVSTGYIGTRDVLWTDDLIGRIIGWGTEPLPLPQGGEMTLPSSLRERRVAAHSLKESCKRLDWQAVKAWLARIRELSDRPAANSELYDFMNWEEVRELHRQGFEIGSHTVEHPILSRISQAALHEELTASKVKIEQELEGSACKAIAYPNGGAADVSPTVFAAARTAGYQLGFVVGERHSPPGEDVMAVSRLCIQGHLPMSDFIYRVDGLQRLLQGTAG